MSVTEQVTARLDQLSTLSTLSVTAQSALAGTGTISGLLERLNRALIAARQSATASRVGAQATQSALNDIDVTVTDLNRQTTAIVSSSQHLDGQEASLVGVLRAIVADLSTALADVRRIHQAVAGLP